MAVKSWNDPLILPLAVDFETSYKEGTPWNKDVEKDTLTDYSKKIFLKGNETRKTDEDWYFNGGILLAPDSNAERLTVYTSANTEASYNFLVMSALSHRAIL